MLKENKQHEWTNNKGLFRLNLVSNYLEPIHNKYISNNLDINDAEEDKEIVKNLLNVMSEFYLSYHHKNKNNSFNIDFLQSYSLAVSYYAAISLYLNDYDNAIKLSVSAYETCPVLKNNWIAMLDDIIANSCLKSNKHFQVTLKNMFKENGNNDFEDCVVQAQKLAEYFAL